VQVAFSIQFASGIPYFRSLGISQIAATLAWLIPPLCGSFVQPLFGRWSDDCGRRKPFIVTGSLGIVIALLGYAWSPNLADLLSRVSEGKLSSTVLSQSLVVCFFLCLNVAIQPVQSGLRALMVDKCAASQQAEMTAWASRINFVASMASYLAAASDLAGESPVSTKQLQALVNLSIVVIVISVGVTCCVVSENSLTRPDPPEATEGISKTWKMLSPRLFRIYLVQFFSWFAWFPVLVQITGFIDTLNRASQNPLQSEDMKSESPGAAALFAQACVALVASIMLPRLVQWASVAAANSKHKIISAYVRDTARSELWVLQMLWLTSQVLFSILLSLTFLKHKTLAILAIALSGICWCVTQWVPFVLVNEEVIRIEDRRRHAALDSHTSLLLSAHNTFIASPQILATAVSSGIFEVLKAQSSSDPVDNVFYKVATHNYRFT
ncbi:MFS general substrate transporter, partial [Colletotrichum asianum]